MDNQTANVITERIDDFPLLLSVMLKANLPDILDRHLGRHGLQQGLSWGWIATIWLAHMMTEGDHRKEPVQAWVRQAHETIKKISGQQVAELDFTDDRLTILLRRISNPETWHLIEKSLGENFVRVYDLNIERVRMDATTLSGYHEGGEESIFQYGYSKDDPSLKQVKIMMATADPLGLPLVSEVVPGNMADDNLYIPTVNRVVDVIAKSGLVFVGDCKMSAQAIRGHIHSLGHFYLCPLAEVGETANQMAQWIESAINSENGLEAIIIQDEKGRDKRLGEGCVFERTMQVTLASGELLEWIERVHVVRSESYRQSGIETLNHHLQRAIERLQALTPAPGRGKRQIQSEEELSEAAEAVLKAYNVKGLLTYTFQRQESRTTQYIGRGRGKEGRPKREVVKVRYQILAVTRQEEAIERRKQRLGWRFYASNLPLEKLSLPQAVLAYRDEWIIERGFHRLKGTPLSLDPIFVRRDDQVIGMTNLLSIAVRVLTLIEFVVRRNLQQNQETLAGLITSNPKKGINKPTTERLLRAFDQINLTVMHLPDQIIRYVTPLNSLQKRILELLGLDPAIYAQLTGN